MKNQIEDNIKAKIMLNYIKQGQERKRSQNTPDKPDNFLVAIEGRCAAGKSTLAKYLQKELACNLISMDSFFPQPEQRTKEWLEAAGGNIDYERFLTEVMYPLEDGEAFSYRPYDCHQMAFGEPIAVTPNPITIIEGSYSYHPLFAYRYDMSIFIHIEPEEQRKRLIERNGEEGAEIFFQKWIPLEEQYFEQYKAKERCEYKIMLP